MAIVLPFPLTIQEIRVLQEYRRVGSDVLTADAVKAIKHPSGGGEQPAKSLVAKGYLESDGADGGYRLNDRSREFLARDVKPEFEGTTDSDEPAE